MKNLKLVSAQGKGRTVVRERYVEIGGGLTEIAGPCSVESERQMLETARAVCAAGADLLRGGAFKPRTSPYSFQGFGLAGLKILATSRRETGRLSLIEPMSLAAVAAGADGLIIEVHNDPPAALCDADQALEPNLFAGLMSRVRPLVSFMEGCR